MAQQDGWRANCADDAARWPALAALALIVTALNAAVPLTGDDGAYHAVALRLRAAPLDPYGGTLVFWGFEWPRANFLAPPVLPYWWALAIALFGDDPVASKLALLPFAAILTLAIFDLLRRFAAGLAVPFVWIAMLSPWILPNFNAMLDVPATALAVAAVALQFRAAERAGWGLAIVAGVVAGLAMQTKYTAVAAPAAILLHGALERRLGLAVLAAAVAAGVFVLWEALAWSHYGQSHFLEAFSQRTSIWHQFVRLRQLLYGLLANNGLLACGVLPILAFAVWRRPSAAIAAGIAAATALAAVAAGFDRWPVAAATGIPAQSVPTVLTLCGLSGLAAAVLFGAIAWREWRTRAAAAATPLAFLLGWLAIEGIVYFLLSPFPAARRGIGVLCVALLVVAHALARGRNQPSRLVMRAGAAFAVAVGLAFWSVSYVDATNLVKLARSAAAATAGPSPAWFYSTLSFDHHAAAAGLRPLLIGRTVLRAGDRLVVAPADLLEAVPWDRSRIEPIAELRAGTNLGVRLTPDFFIGQSPVIAEPDSRPTARLYRVTAEGPLAAPAAR